MTGKEELGTLIVTGASRGIGAAVATLAGERGYAVAVNFATGEANAKKVVDEIVAGGGRAVSIRADISSEQQIVRMFQTAERELGPIKALVNNAGITGGFARVEEVSSAAITSVLAVNVGGAMLCLREAVRRMSTRRGGTGGAIVNISSRAAHYALRICGRVGTLRGIERRDRQLHHRTRTRSRNGRHSCERRGAGIGRHGVACRERRSGPPATDDGEHHDGKRGRAARNRGRSVVAVVPGSVVHDWSDPGNRGRALKRCGSSLCEFLCSADPSASKP